MAGVLGEINNNLMGLQALAQGRQQIQKEQTQVEDNRIASENLRRFQESQKTGKVDYESLNEAIIRSPQLSQNVLAGLGIQEKRQGTDAASFVTQAASLVGSPDEFMRTAVDRVNYLQQSGRDPKDTIALIKNYQEGNIDEVKNSLKAVGAALTNQGYLDKDIYASTFGVGAGAMTPYQAERLKLDRERLDRDAEGTSNQKDWAEYQRLLKTDPEAARRFGAAAGFETKEGQKLSSFSEKQLAEASDEYNSASSASNRYVSLAEKLRTANASGGVKSTWSEYIKEQTGNQDEITALRKEALAISNSEAIKNLPPGPATDRDIQIVMAPFPTEKAAPEYIANWLESMARLNEKRAEYAEFKADFIARNGSLRNKEGKSIAAEWKAAQKQMQQEQAPAQEAQTQPAQPATTTKTVSWNDL